MVREKGLSIIKEYWHIDFYHDGKRYRHTTGCPVEYGRGGKAKKPPEKAVSMRDEVYRDKDAWISKKNPTNTDISVSCAVSKYLSFCNDFRDIHTRAYLLSLVSDRFIGKRMSEIGPDEARSWVDNVEKRGLSIRSVNMRVQYASALWNWSIGEGYAIENPFGGLKRGAERGRERVLTEEEEVALLRACQPWFRPIVQTAIYTGLRQGNIIRLKRSHIDSSDGWIRIPRWDTKGGRTSRGRVDGTLEVPLNSGARGALRSVVPNPTHEFWFSSPSGGPLNKDIVTSAFRTARKRSGIENITFHDLRHTAATRAAQSGMDAPTMKEIFGWSDISMVQKYVNVSKDHKQKMMERMGGVV